MLAAESTFQIIEKKVLLNSSLSFEVFLSGGDYIVILYGLQCFSIIYTVHISKIMTILNAVLYKLHEIGEYSHKV